MIRWLLALVFSALCLVLALVGAAFAVGGAPVVGFVVMLCAVKGLAVFALRLCR